LGLFFDQRRPDPRVVGLLREAIQTPPPHDAQQQAARLAGELKPLTEPVRAALESQPPADPADAAALASAKAEAITNELLGGSSFNTGRFLVALLIFAVLLGGAIATDAVELKSSPAALYALATTVFGVVVGFLGSEKP